MTFDEFAKSRKMIAHTQNLTGDRTIRQFMGKASNIYIIEDNRQKATFLVDCGIRLHPFSCGSCFRVDVSQSNI
jgi:hypothetical protein